MTFEHITVLGQKVQMLYDQGLDSLDIAEQIGINVEMVEKIIDNYLAFDEDN